jgi:hypothetical protein
MSLEGGMSVGKSERTGSSEEKSGLGSGGLLHGYSWGERLAGAALEEGRPATDHSLGDRAVLSHSLSLSLLSRQPAQRGSYEICGLEDNFCLQKLMTVGLHF